LSHRDRDSGFYRRIAADRKLVSTTPRRFRREAENERMQNVLEMPAIRTTSVFSGEERAAAIELMNVSKRFEDIVAVDNINLTVPQGQVIALLGPNGAGKTTAISMMLGLRRPTSGSVRLFGLAPTDLHARTRTGVMLQESGVSMVLRASELIELFRSYYPYPLDAKTMIEMADLGEKVRAKAGDLSGGQRQRLYFALAICGNPDLLFLDEPSAGLDVETRRGLWEQVRKFQNAGKTIVLTTHYLEEADALADRVVVIDKGRIVADDTPAGIKGRTAGKRVRFDLGPDAPPALFDGVSLEGLQRNGPAVGFLTNQPEAVLATLFARGAQITNLEVTGAGLEEAFISLTHGAEADR
jgi:ABC-2 type transport system ATP-binding protein